MDEEGFIYTWDVVNVRSDSIALSPENLRTDVFEP